MTQPQPHWPVHGLAPPPLQRADPALLVTHKVSTEAHVQERGILEPCTPNTFPRCYSLWAGSWPDGQHGGAPFPVSPSGASAGHPEDGRGLLPTWSQMSSHFFSLSYWLSSWTLSGGKFMQFWGGRGQGKNAEPGPQYGGGGAWASPGNPRGASSPVSKSVIHMSPHHPHPWRQVVGANEKTEAQRRVPCPRPNS